MARFVAKHLVFLLLTLFVVSFLVFALNEFSPGAVARKELGAYATQEQVDVLTRQLGLDRPLPVRYAEDRKSTRLNSSHRTISYAVFCLKKKKTINIKKSNVDLTT